MQEVLRYIDPGTGGLPYQNLAPMWVWLTSFLAFLALGMRQFFQQFKSRFPFKKFLLLVLFILLCGGIYLLTKHLSEKKLVLIGMDGMDPAVLERLMAEGKLPHFKALAEKGSYRKLRTTTPSESPVAWSTLATGMNPGKHGIFGFIQRDPKNYIPSLTFYRMTQSSVQSVRKGEPFWKLAGAAGVPTVVLRFPVTFPAESFEGTLLSGLGVPDVRGTLGRFSYYVSDEKSVPDLEEVRTKGWVYEVRPGADGAMVSMIKGPVESGPRSKEFPLEFRIRPSAGQVEIEIQGQKLSVREKEWSDWARMEFKISLLNKVHGIARFYLIQAQPLKLYLSPIEMSPEKPAFPISHPQKYSAQLAEQIGTYHTLGMPEDTNALSEEVLSDEVFLEQCEQVMAEREKMLDLELSRFKKGLFVFIFDQPDRIQHMFWKHGTEEPIERVYRRLDGLLGKVMDKIDSNTTLIVCSDHGFSSFEWNLHLNAWLRDHGYLALQPGSSTSREFFSEVDWSKTKAYAMGLNGIYINQKGREGQGAVSQTESAALMEKLRKELLGLKDPDGKPVFSKIHLSREIYSGSETVHGPDLLIGCQPGFRTSKETVLGAVPQAVFARNAKKWSGDHVATDSALVPGVFVSNKRFKSENPGLEDLAPTLLAYFGVRIPPEIDGKPLE